MKHLFLLLLGAGSLLACQKDDAVLYVVDGGPASLTEALRPHVPAVQTFSLVLGQAQTVRTAAGATLSFPANAFRWPDGQTLATGQAELRVREIYTVPGMVLANLPTTASNGEHLVSGGEFNVQVWQGNVRLRLLPSVGTANSISQPTLTAPVPTAGLDTARMRLWWLPANAFAPTAPDSSGWEWRIGNAARPLWLRPVNGFYTAALPLDSIGWWNIDQSWSAYRRSGGGRVLVDVPAGASETRVYFRPLGYHILARCVGTAVPTQWASGLPGGIEAIAVVLQLRNGQLYYGTQRLTTRPGLVVTPVLEALSPADVLQRIRAL